MHLVWFKRDLRLIDHAPLAEAAAQGPVLGLFVFEPSLWRQPTMDRAHFDFVAASLAELGDRLARLGGQLLVRTGEVVDVLAALHAERPLTALHSHQETGDLASYARDRAVGAWARAAGVPWREHLQGGVIRRLRSRDGWAERWGAFMQAPVVPRPLRVERPEGWASGGPPDPVALGVAGASRPLAQPGGAIAGQALLRSFLAERGRDYRSVMGKPGPAEDACSRLSPHLAWGTVSARQAYHAGRLRLAELEGLAPTPEVRAWMASLASFEARLAWRCHFMQKLEDEPAIEARNMCRAYDGLREDAFDAAAFAAWAEGRTGYPLVDACMRSLAATGWLPFRMRAMVTAFAAYDLWLHWERPAWHLARLFLDYEPGIHYPQIQMQSGTTGINALRMYDVTKQAREVDPDGHFIRRWVPELEGVPLEHLHAPWEMPPLTRLLVRGGEAYPPPIVARREAVARARAGFAAVRARPETEVAAREVLARHGSRRSGDARVFRPGARPRA
ncbi:MAG: FAD-binding domain-containing protein [Candidatus Sericytochromatia bacterium]|nr:FAD-binding domain-containing protein [Candidatus Sericytochromatia bacterium]